MNHGSAATAASPTTTMRVDSLQALMLNRSRNASDTSRPEAMPPSMFRIGNLVAIRGPFYPSPSSHSSSSSTDDDMPGLMTAAEMAATSYAASATRRTPRMVMAAAQDMGAASATRRSARIASSSPTPATAAHRGSLPAVPHPIRGLRGAAPGRRAFFTSASRDVPELEPSSPQERAAHTPAARGANKRDRSARSSTKRACLKSPPPGSTSPEDSKPKADEPDDVKPAARDSCAEANTCTICMCESDRTEISSIDGCNHLYCFSCIDKWSERENTCPLCKARFCKIKRLHPQRKKRGSSDTPAKNTKRVKQRDQRSDILPSAALEGILANIVRNHGGGSLDRLFFAHVGNGDARRRGIMTARISAAGGTGFASHPLFGLSVMNDDDDDDDGFGHLIDGFPGIGIMGAILRQSSSTARVARMPRAPPAMPELSGRSHASNSADSSAGHAASNPLEIDDDSDGEVEVIGTFSR